jgi:alginate O-acetyltransferase complex protein AlgI
LHPLVTPSAAVSATNLAIAIAWVLGLLFIALALPNSLQVMARYEPALGVKPQPADMRFIWRVLDWRPSMPSAIAFSVLAATAIMRTGGKSEFLYWQF